MAEGATTPLDAGVHRTRYDPSDPETLPRAVIAALEAATGTSPTELPPLQYTVDLEAMASIVERSVAGSADSAARIAFSYESWTVVVHCDGRVVVSESTGDADECGAASD